MAKLTFYSLAQCSTCKKARAWLQARGIDFDEKAIRVTPPSPHELRRMLAYQRGEIRRLFNTSGQDYRAAGLKDTLPHLSDDAAIALLAANGSLVKRPFLIGPDVGLVGFHEPTWQRALG